MIGQQYYQSETIYKDSCQAIESAFGWQILSASAEQNSLAYGKHFESSSLRKANRRYLNHSHEAPAGRADVKYTRTVVGSKQWD